MDDREQSVQHFLDLIKRSHRGKFKIYIGMIAGVGKSYRMLQSAMLKLTDVSEPRRCCKGSLSFRGVRFSIREKNWKRWT